MHANASIGFGRRQSALGQGTGTAGRHAGRHHGAGDLEPLRRPCGTTLTIPHAWALLELRANPGLSVLELADRLNIDASNVSRLCVRMESSGELRRETCPRDRRAKRLKLTAKGRKVAQRVDTASAKHFATVWKELGDAAPAAVDALEHVARALRAASGAAT